MPRPGWTTVSLRNERLQSLERMFEKDSKKPQTQRFGAWLDNFLYELTTHEEELETHGPFMSVENVSGDHILIADYNKINDYVFVRVNSKEKRLECENDQSSDCVHVGFCFAIPSVYRVLLKNGIKPRRISKPEHTSGRFTETAKFRPKPGKVGERGGYSLEEADRSV